MTFEYKGQFPKRAANNGNGNGAGPHDPAAAQMDTSKRLDDSAVAADDPMRLAEPARLDERVTRYVPTPSAPRDHGREDAAARAEKQSPKSLRLREHLDCEPPWDILRARASFDSPASPEEPWPDRFDIWPADKAGYWPCPICATPLVPVDRTPMKLFRCVSCDTETFVHVKAPVVNCPRHGRHEIDLPWMLNDLKWTYVGIEPSESAHPGGGVLHDITDGSDPEP
jgi:hypothetical protein